MRAPLKTLLVVLPLSALLTILLAFWKDASKEVRYILLGAIALVCVGLTLQAWLSHTRYQPLVFLQRQVHRRAVNLPPNEVVKRPDGNTYVYVEHDKDNTIVLWCFNGDELEQMEENQLEEAHVFVRGFRLNTRTGEAANYYGQAHLRRNPQDGTFAIAPPQPDKEKWRAGPFVQLPQAYRGALARVKTAISRVESRGRRHRFHK